MVYATLGVRDASMSNSDFTPDPNNSVYLGDGAYAQLDHDLQGVWVYSFDGLRVENAVFLEVVSVERLLEMFSKA